MSMNLNAKSQMNFVSASPQPQDDLMANRTPMTRRMRGSLRAELLHAVSEDRSQEETALLQLSPDRTDEEAPEFGHHDGNTMESSERTQQLWRRRFQQIGAAVDPTPEEVELERSVSDEPVPASALVVLGRGCLCAIAAARRELTAPLRIFERAPITEEEYKKAQEQLRADQEAATKAMKEFKDRSLKYKSLNEKLPKFAALQGNERGEPLFKAFVEQFRHVIDAATLVDILDFQPAGEGEQKEKEEEEIKAIFAAAQYDSTHWKPLDELLKTATKQKLLFVRMHGVSKKYHMYAVDDYLTTGVRHGDDVRDPVTRARVGDHAKEKLEELPNHSIAIARLPVQPQEKEPYVLKAEHIKQIEFKPNAAQVLREKFHKKTFDVCYNALCRHENKDSLQTLKHEVEKATVTDVESFTKAIKAVKGFEGHAGELAEKCSTLNIETVKLAIDAAIAYKGMQAAEDEMDEAKKKLEDVEKIIRRFNNQPPKPKGIKKQWKQ